MPRTIVIYKHPKPAAQGMTVFALGLQAGMGNGAKQLEQGGNANMKNGLYANIHAKRERIKAGSGEKMRKAGAKGAPSASDFKEAAKTRKEVITEKMKDM
jgi:hypothetical protein